MVWSGNVELKFELRGNEVGEFREWLKDAMLGGEVTGFDLMETFWPDGRFTVDVRCPPEYADEVRRKAGELEIREV